jgi:hypothetical protein
MSSGSQLYRLAVPRSIPLGGDVTTKPVVNSEIQAIFTRGPYDPERSDDLCAKPLHLEDENG